MSTDGNGEIERHPDASARRGAQADPGRLRKRSVVIAGHRTSVSLENAFWQALSRIADARKLSMNALIAEIDRDRPGNLSSALRVFVLREFESRPSPTRSTDRAGVTRRE